MRNRFELLRLRCRPPAESPGLESAVILPFRGFLTYQVRARAPGLGSFDLLDSPPLEVGLERLTSGVNDLGGAQSVTLGGSLLTPYANRIRGELALGGEAILAEVDGLKVRLPANRAGPGREPCAIHGLLLEAEPPEITHLSERRAEARFTSADFSGGWPSRLEIRFAIELAPTALEVEVRVRNVGSAFAPVGIGWHPYLRIPSRERAQARLRLAGRHRLLLNNYDEVFPTGAVEAVAGTPFDFTSLGGRALGDQFLDDCFTDLAVAGDGVLVAELIDPAAGLRLQLSCDAPPVTAVQVYAPRQRNCVAIEPQYNLINPFGLEWRGRDTGMVRLRPGEETRYRARVAVASLAQA